MQKEIEVSKKEKQKIKTFNSTQDTAKLSNIEKTDCKIIKS